MKLKLRQSQRGETGIFLPIIAVLATSIFAVIFLLSFNVILMRRATAIFRDRAEDVCRLTATPDNFNFLGTTVQNFRSHVDNVFDPANLQSVLASDRFELTRADLVIPTMATGSSFWYRATPGGRFTGYRDFSHGDVLGGGNGCSQVSGGDCRLSVTAPTGSPKIFPGVIMHGNAGAFNTFGCHFEAKLKIINFMGALSTVTDANGDIPLRAVYSYWRPVDGNFPQFKTADIDSQPPSDSTLLQQAPGLTIAVSTHLQTRADDSRFLFGGAHSAFNPVDHTSANLTTFGYINNFANNTVTESHTDSGLNFEALAFGGVGVADPAFAGGVSISPAYEMAVACMNPLVLVRNQFLTRLMQLITRHGYLRGSTELLHISTQHRWYDPASPPAADAAPLRYNPPVKLVPFGQDLLLPGSDQFYQLPFVYYHTGGGPDWSSLANGTAAEDAYYSGTNQRLHGTNAFQYQAFGRVNPWVRAVSPGRSEPVWRKYHALLANQLRVCAHLYQDHGHGVEHPRIPSYDARFEAAEFDDVEGAVFDYPVVTTPLQQRCPWGGAVGSCTGGAGSGVSRPNLPVTDPEGVDALTLVGMLGSTQQCPYTLQPADAEFFDTGTSTMVSCQKPLPQFDLRPDFVALATYLSGATDAVLSPGFFPITTDYAASSSGIYDAPFAALAGATNTNTPVVIVTHRAPRAEETALISAALATTTSSPHTPNGNWGNRRIIVVFMPANETELNFVSNLQEAFKTRYDDDADPCENACEEDQNFRNVLYVLDPRSDNGGETTPYCSAGSCTAANFRDFWFELFLSGSSSSATLAEEYGIDSYANRVFHRIVRPALRKY